MLLRTIRLGAEARYAALNEEDRIAYKKSLKAYRDAYAIAETERAEGRAQGIAEGLAKGLAQGCAKGEQIERRKSISMMLSFGIQPEQIADKYGISVTEVMRIAGSDS